VFSRRWKRLAPAFFAYAARVAWSRIYLNRHFLSDVVVGAMIGFGWAYAVGLWVAERQRKRAGKSR
jgi:membrane-associated phospholipid phosphatase